MRLAAIREAARGRRLVGLGARADDEGLGVVGGEEVAGSVGVPVVAAERGGKGLGLVEPGGIEGGLVEGESRLDHGGVIGGEAGKDGFAGRARHGRGGRRASWCR